MNLDLSNIPKVNTDQVEKHLTKFQNITLPDTERLEYLKYILRMIDLTTLNGSDNERNIKELCYNAIHLADEIKDVDHVAAVCVYPNFARCAKQQLGRAAVNVASVAGGFPSGQTSIEIKKAEIQYALDEGADEIDMVISRGTFLAGEYNIVYDEIASLKEICGTKHLKVILETGQLGNLNNVRLASEIAIAAGADFIKTSTGKNQPAATLEATYVMLQAIKEHHKRTGHMIGMKPAGGIATAEVALQYLSLLNDTLGENWMTKEYFRFGASRLAKDVVSRILLLQA